MLPGTVSIRLPPQLTQKMHAITAIALEIVPIESNSPLSYESLDRTIHATLSLPW
ncbi:hypothetical protein CUJ84_pRLN3000202 (plasmid) [Rhizobium leguminosarum]|uniref:Uncharacterized protein n=1 Tax=Rhizobium leguminosarum TaxID=384 RepID=A0A2K9ZH15_RHILE|nr:hypothetical protein CUJ84_pRLN3000202 [Rhizobium leguminosarum]